VLFVPDSIEGAMVYQKNLNAPYEVDETLLRAWAENITQNVEWLESIGIEANESTYFSPEWPTIEGSEHCKTYLVGEGLGLGQLWYALADVARDRGIEIRHDTRAQELVTNPLTREVLGVRATTPAGDSYLKARKGVILACGGFENSPEMIATYYQMGYCETRPMGTPYNRGDGVKMAQSVGADLWHMNNFSNSSFGVSAGGNDSPNVCSATWGNKDYLFISPDGKRFMYEEMISLARHGKYRYNGSSTNVRQPIPAYAVFGSVTFDGKCIIQPSHSTWLQQMEQVISHDSNQAYLDAGVIVSGQTASELGSKIGVDPQALEETITTWNTNAAVGIDTEFKRGTDVYSDFNYGAAKDSGETNASAAKPSISAFNLVPLEAPYYAIQMFIQTLNTQGGPRRGVGGEVLDTNGTPIPRLYAAGELGCIYAFNYNGGGNVSEALSSGRLAARSAGTLSNWEV
jgi:succinate dehydrogenase/fumarate reductase flavoprotein subunit